MVKIGKTQIIWKALGRPFAFSEVESSLTASWLGRNTSSFVELHNLIYHELVPDRIVLPIEEAKRLAQKAATEAASLAMPPEAERAQVSSEVFVRPGAVSVLVTIDAIEEIGVARPVRWP
jgi:DNA-directed RNA polymerase subunit H (RpoH/RPB5)